MVMSEVLDTASKLENENPNSVQDILRGNAAGLNVGISTSAKGGGSLQVRGQTSLNAGNSPLLVLDGAIYYGELADINPNDIENLEVLKDASAAAVFGAKAANGVILITTKKGTVGKSIIKFNANAGLASYSHSVIIKYWKMSLKVSMLVVTILMNSLTRENYQVMCL